ncbi:DUF6445 family protein [Candidatus Phycosocius spiralis]|uniref:Uncharacterized protein n=1 Tax=Candidatus Phycosocius spiralis TaxID=2815099 RepID=A0ABQ4PVQ3_9PROT|nr:DUF6445 family protein [Candidatus Phycosocius spiralis]GIU67063.1 hypothetical protein PsB1_1217 [Candidatus Phycosocius spiralis]
MENYRPSDDITVTIHSIGTEQTPVMVIDHLCAEPELLLRAAAQAHFIDIGPTYPGVRAPSPSGYGDWVLKLFASQLRDLYGGNAPWGFDLCAFSLVTTPPAALTPLQSLPHFDGVEATRLAFLHYLCEGEHGGTSFYRQRATGFERLSPDRLHPYLLHLKKETTPKERHSYFMGSNASFERIGGVEAQFNRAIFYPGSLLHSGDILAPHLLSENVRTGRLTINGFVVLEPF